MKSATNFFLIFTGLAILAAAIKAAYGLRCRSDDGPSEAELKRVIRSCMRKFGDANFAQNNQQQQQQQNQQQNRQKSRSGNRENYGYGGYEDSDEMNDGDMQDYGQYNGGNFNNNRQQNSYNRNGGGGSYSSSSSSSSYDSYDERRHNRGRYAGTYNNRTNNYGGGQNQNNNWPYNYNNNNQRNYANSRGYNNNNNNNNNNNSNKSRNNNNNGNNNQNNFSNDSACIVHCFFEEMHMLNNNNYPDRHKVLYILTKDMRDRDLRNFYTDTIQECFQYLDTQRRRDQCQFSRDLINCMTEYAKGNCDDWNDFSMVFN